MLQTKDENSKFLDRKILKIPETILQLYSSTKRTFDFLLKDGPVSDLKAFQAKFSEDLQKTKAYSRTLTKTSQGDIDKLNSELKGKKEFWTKQMYTLHINSDHNLITLANHYASFRVTKQNLQLEL